ncbi:unnamed protein product [Alopecurus aequalis]
MAQQDQDMLHYYLYSSVVLATILLVPLLLIKLRPGNQHGRNPPPGPWQLPVIGNLHHLVGAIPHHAMRDLARRHGPLMLLRLGELNLVVASSATTAKEVTRTHDAIFATRPQTATIKTLTRNGVGIAMAPQGEHWRQARMLCVNELLSSRRVRSLQSTREAEIARMVASLASDSAASHGQPVNVSSHIAAYSNNVVVRAVVGDRMTDRDGFLECMEEGVKVAAGFSLADLFPSWRLAASFSGTMRRLEANTSRMMCVMDGVIEEHRARRSAAGTGGGEEEHDLLDVLLSIQKDGAPLHIRNIRALIIDLFAAGSETTASTLQWAMAQMMRNPEVLGRAQVEVRGALAGQSRVPEEALPELPYVQLVIKETLRLHPVAPLLLPRECQEPCRVLGYDVPEGAMVLVNAWALARETATWGPDAEEFRPDRFEDNACATVDFRGNNFQFLPFGSGRRMCPGVMFSMAVMEIALASLLFHFDWELPAGSEVDMEEVLGITARRKNDLWLHATLRVLADS